MKSSKILPYGAVVLGSVITLAGLVLVGMYVLEAIVARVGEPDQSLLFWYLAILFMGLGGKAIGIVMGAWNVRRLLDLRLSVQTRPTES